MIESCEMYSKVEISNIVFRGVEVKKSEIRLKSENLHPCTKECYNLDASVTYGNSSCDQNYCKRGKI